MKNPDPKYRAGQTNSKGSRICGAKTSEGTPCQKYPMPNGRCNTHGGMTPSGFAAHKFKDGRHSKYLPSALLERYGEGMSDPHLVELRAEISLLDVRITQLTEKVSEGENGEFWREISKLWTQFVFAVHTGNQKEQDRLFPLISSTIQNGSSEYKAWEDIASLVDKRRKLVDTEQRRLVQAQQMITVEQAMIMLTACIASLREVVHTYADQTTAKHILTEASHRYTKLISIPAIDISSSSDVGGSTG